MTVESTPTISSGPKSLKRRAAYSLAAGAAACAATSSADAAVQYSGVQNISILSGVSAYELNLDGDSYNDIKLKNYIFSGGKYQGATVIFGPGQLVGFSAGNAYVSALNLGAPINSSTIGPSFFGSMAYGALNPNAQFNNVTNRYLGLSFPSGANLYYGWIRVDVNNAAGTFVIKDWAYQATSRQGILAGEVPEPGTLGLLAAGGLGVAALRRRRRCAE